MTSGMKPAMEMDMEMENKRTGAYKASPRALYILMGKEGEVEGSN